MLVQTAMKPALLGGAPVRTEPFPAYPVIGDEEKAAVMAVLDSGRLSTFSASRQGFLGGQQIQAFEKAFAAYHGVKHAIAVNSATSGLHAAVAACGIGPGDEVIVPPYTFTATATAVLHHNAIPVFADVDPVTFCLDPRSVERAITPRTKAIIPVHLLGHPAEMGALLAIARKHGLSIIEDCAQAPGARYHGRLVGTMGDCGVYSFQETKNMATGEGGMIVTDNDELAERARMVRNHGEAVVAGEKRSYLSSTIGWNYRMTEIEAAIGLVQLRKLDALNQSRRDLAGYLLKHLPRHAGLGYPDEPSGLFHVYHVFAATYDEDAMGLPRARFLEALAAEGIPVGGGYPRPLYHNPLF
ncbi:MAG TPA: DegT/DnrJ/EryC1/StrS family aminotransferase, partial [Nitrospirales bacterium]|nr:DegT/DnrJ/EryC1/StrS family aminotransferase [Nitrospirales bacterium]